jgi:hypothetical protein
MATVSAHRTPYEAGYDETVAERATGWVGFAMMLLGLAGGWNVLQGFLALANSKVFVANATYVFSDLRTWGWIVLLLGIAQVCAAFALLGGNQLARWFAVAVAGVNAVGQLLYLPAAPFWALSMFALDLVIIYGLTVYGGRDAA